MICELDGDFLEENGILQFFIRNQKAGQWMLLSDTSMFMDTLENYLTRVYGKGMCSIYYDAPKIYFSTLGYDYVWKSDSGKWCSWTASFNYSYYKVGDIEDQFGIMVMEYGMSLDDAFSYLEMMNV